jgi:lysophospholipase L1-like esterase
MRYGSNDAISENQTLENIAQKYSITFIDNNQIFYQLGEQQDRFFQPKNRGSHCNAKGYKLMAQNIYNKIIEENIFNLKQ